MNSFSKFIFLSFFFLVSCSNLRSQKENCYRYDEKVSIEGKLETRPYPNQKAKYWILITKPFCTIIDKDEELYEAFQNETEIHVVIKDKFEPYRPLLEKQVVAYGELYSQYTGHHMRKVLLMIDKIEEKK